MMQYGRLSPSYVRGVWGDTYNHHRCIERRVFFDKLDNRRMGFNQLKCPRLNDILGEWGTLSLPQASVRVKEIYAPRRWGRGCQKILMACVLSH